MTLQILANQELEPPSNGNEFSISSDCFQFEIDPNTMTLAEIMAKTESAVSMAIQSLQTKCTALMEIDAARFHPPL